jgi:hypothetical protein
MNYFKKFIGGMKLWQDVQHQFTGIARQVEGQAAQYVEVEVVIEATTLIPHILYRIHHHQTALQVVVVMADKLR